MYKSYNENRARLQIPPEARAQLLGVFTTAAEQNASIRQDALQAAENRAAQFITNYATAREQQVEQ